MFPRVSFIIPVYNSQQYILKCLESVEDQSFRDFEVILVNDGSTDESKELITKFVQGRNLKNYRLIEKENGGVSSARNKGIEIAKGEWIAFIDSDDWIEPDYLLNMIDAIDKYRVDLCLCGFRAFDVATETSDVWSDYPVDHGTIPEGLSSLTSFDYVWARLYKRSIIEENGITFDESIFYCEDNAFNFDYIRVSRSYACVNDVSYNYRRGQPGALSKGMVYPQMRAGFVPHMRRFCDSFSESDITTALKNNTSFSRIMWNVISTDVVMDILNKNYKSARAKIKEPLSKAIVDSRTPISKKDSLFLFLWRRSFLCLSAVVRVYYGNFDSIKKHKRFSYFISHK